MIVLFRTGLSLAAVTSLASVCACTSDDQPTSAGPSPAVSAMPTPTTAASLSALGVPDTGRVIEHLQNRAGAWEMTVGKDDDEGALDISVSCVGGGNLAFSYAGGSSSPAATASVPCRGSVEHNRDAAASPGPVHVAIKPDGTQKWSVLIVRGMQVAE